MQAQIDKLNEKVKELENEVFELRIMRDNSVLQGKLNTIRYIESQNETMTIKLGELENFITAFNEDDKFVEIFKPHELKTYYIDCGIGLLDIVGYLKKLTGEEWTGEQTSKALDGMADIRVISRLGKWLRTKALRNEKTA